MGGSDKKVEDKAAAQIFSTSSSPVWMIGNGILPLQIRNRFEILCQNAHMQKNGLNT